MATAQPFLSTSDVARVLRATSPAPPVLAWPWEWADDFDDEEEDGCAHPACRAPLEAFAQLGYQHLVYDAGDSRTRVCSPRCAAKIEHRAKVRNARHRARHTPTSELDRCEARVAVALAYACRIAREGERTPAGQIVLRAWLSPTLDGAVAQVRVERALREIARERIASGAQCTCGDYVPDTGPPYRYARRCTRTVGHRGACRIEAAS